MLLEFTVGNYLSFKDKKTLSLEAASIKEFPENVITNGKYKILRSAVIYGANSSGKSNLLKALITVLDIVKNSTKLNSTDEINVTPFLLNTETENQPSHFELMVLIEGVQYRYGFEACRKKVHYEWLYKKEGKRKETLLFLRDGNRFELTENFSEGEKLESKTRENALFLAVCDQFNGEESHKIMEWFGQFSNLSGIDHAKERNLTIFFLENEYMSLNEKLNLFIKSLNLGFEKYFLSDKVSKFIKTIHSKYDMSGQNVGNYEFDMTKQESSGTNKIFDLAGYIVVGLHFGWVTIIDEMDAKLHPLLTKQIVQMFNNPEINTANGQLIFVSHDTNLLSYANLRRDQIYFAEKNEFEETDLYSLVEFKEPNGTKVRNDRRYEKDYIEGRYGAIPFVGDFSKLMQNGQDK